jgi:RecB family exonuclease
VTASEIPAIPVTAGAAEAETEVLLAAPVIRDQRDPTASVTSVALFAACPRRYYLGRYLGLEPEPDDSGTGAMALGDAVHQILAGQTIDSPEAHELAARFTAGEWGQRAARAQRIEHEFDFLYDFNGMILRGQIDLWFEEAGQLVMVDYKTDRDVDSASSYALQLQLYALALERYTQRLPDRAVLFYVRSQQSVDVDLTPAALDAARQRVAQLIAAQASGEFPLRPGDQCRKCSFFGGLCPEGRGEEGSTGLVFGRPSSLLTLASDGL